jgi:exonuclease SbcC
MIPISLTLIGFKGIRDGLGRECITIDFADLTNGAELVALTGRNGRGKSTILDNMTPYPIMPSKAGADGLGAFSYYEEVYLPESQKELTWDMDGVRYRSHIVIRDNGKRKTEAYLHAQQDGGWRPVRLQDGTVSDGRMETYVRCVEGVAGAAATFFTTAFSAQNRRQLSSYRNAEIKSLLADLLGLDQIRTYGEQASETQRCIRTALLALRQSSADRQRERGKLADMVASLGDVAQQSALARQNRQIAAERRDARREEVSTLAAQRNMSQCHETRRTQLQQERRSAIDNGHTAQAHLDQLEHAARDGLSRLQQRAAQRTAQREANLASLRAQLTCLQRTIHSGRHVARAVRRQALLKITLQQRDQSLDQWQQAATRQEALKNDAALKASQMSALEREAGQAVLAAQELRRRFGLTDEVPCSGTPLQQRCKLLDDARAAKPLLPDASAKIARLDMARQALRRELADLREQIATGANGDASLKMAKAKRCRTEARLSWELQLAARQADIAHAHASLNEVERHLAPVMAEAPAEQAVETVEAQAHQAQLDNIADQHRRQAEQQHAALARIDALLAELPPAFDEATLARAVTGAAQAAAALECADKALVAAITAAQRRDELIHRLEACDTQCQEVDRQMAQIEGEIARWSLFAKCMGNDGIIALAIDDAGPELSMRANQLLLACYGPRFTTSIQTQLTNAKGELKEGFEITVHDAWRNTSKNVAKMSGGERIWINECLTRAMALYLAEAASRRSSTLFSDEADGAFDAQHKRQFMAMKREVLRMGGYVQEYFISHTPELSAMADAVIDLDQFATGDAAPIT